MKLPNFIAAACAIGAVAAVEIVEWPAFCKFFKLIMPLCFVWGCCGGGF